MIVESSFIQHGDVSIRFAKQQIISCARVQTCDLEIIPSLLSISQNVSNYTRGIRPSPSNGPATRVSIMAWWHCHTVLPSQNFMQFFCTISFSWASPQRQDAVAKSPSTQTTTPTEAATISLGFSLFLWVVTLDIFWEAETCWNIKK